MAGLRQQPRKPRRKRIIYEESHADRGRGSSRSKAEAAAYRKHSRISPARRSGYSAKIFSSDQPPARSRRTVATGMRRPRTHGTPPICAGSTVMSSKCFMLLPSSLSQAGVYRTSKPASEGTADRCQVDNEVVLRQLQIQNFSVVSIVTALRLKMRPLWWGKTMLVNLRSWTHFCSSQLSSTVRVGILCSRRVGLSYPRFKLCIAPRITHLGLNLTTIFHRYGEPPARITGTFSNGARVTIYIGREGNDLCNRGSTGKLDYDSSQVHGPVIALDLRFASGWSPSDRGDPPHRRIR